MTRDQFDQAKDIETLRWRLQAKIERILSTVNDLRSEMEIAEEDPMSPMFDHFLQSVKAHWVDEQIKLDRKFADI